MLPSFYFILLRSGHLGICSLIFINTPSNSEVPDAYALKGLIRTVLNLSLTLKAVPLFFTLSMSSPFFSFFPFFLSVLIECYSKLILV